ncbi:Kef-type potassium/proton antiporter, CPA2 family [Dyadobacter koreensis]|uniref:Kef-type potassium/proton antiporter, CPA2 family n=1 Tax=Dyadobacter koreensis TaxID=408657 RepID=A0A1H6V8Y9_9BACT|nr:monovalent cation:proton antiporter-2 (CPA2) family protein [Dyadobacter koreensis]SEJ00998.1 Kef-type potassium/proton antiporter, CPA2 family [Dyadobacter koreensis]
MKNEILIQIMIYLTAAVIMVPLAKKLKSGPVLGYLAAGILIGPSALKLVDSDIHEVMHHAEFGVVMLLFIIGLELQPRRIWNMRKNILILGGLQLVATATAIAAIAVFFNMEWRQALVLGIIFSMSSTAIVMQYLTEKGLLKMPVGESSFSVLLFQDIAVIPIFAILPWLKTDASSVSPNMASTAFGENLPIAVHGLIFAISVVIVIVIGRYLIRPILGMAARTGLREMFTAASLLLVIAIAVLMKNVGLSPALGALLAGVVLANSEYRHELEIAIDPFKSLLLGLFFMTVGESINLELILTKPLLIAGIVAGLIFCKLTVLLLLGKLTELTAKDNILFSFALSQTGEFAFVLLSFCAGSGILSNEITDISMAAVAISMAITPILLVLFESFINQSVDDQELAKFETSPMEVDENPVIIAGYGHFGNTVGRFLNANNIGTTVLDNNGDHVEMLRRFGLKVHYGDATRHDVLDIAGARNAKIIVIALGDARKRLQLAQLVKKHFPHLYILTRSTNKYDAFELLDIGINQIYRETFDTGLRLGTDVLKILGHQPEEVAKSAALFFQFDEQSVRQMARFKKEKKSNKEYIESVKETIQNLKELMSAGRALPPKNPAELTINALS